MQKALTILARIIFVVGVLLFVVALSLWGANGRVGAETDYSASPSFCAPPEPSGESMTLRMVTFNIQDLYVAGRNRAVRMRRIGRILTQLDPDIVGFQEAFISRDRKILVDALSGSRLCHHIYFPSGTVGSGLLISSAWPIREAYFERFSTSGPAWRIWEGDFWAGKGVALARIESPAGLIDVYNTHAQAGYGRPEYRQIRMRQMREMAAFIRASRTGTSPAFLVGDLNCHVGDPDFDLAVRKAGLVRTLEIESGVDHIFAVRDARYTFDPLDSMRIEETISEGGRTFPLSDHAGFLSEVRVQPGD